MKKYHSLHYRPHRPEVFFGRFSLFLVDYRQGGLIYLDVIAVKNFGFKHIVKWFEKFAGRFKPSVECSFGNIKPQMLKLTYLTVKRDMVLVLLKQDFG